MNTSFSRRQWLGTMAASLAGLSASGWFPAFAQEQLTTAKKNSKHVILLWMTGGPTQTDTWDMKPGHANGGEFKEIQTASTGLRFSEHLPKLAAQSSHLAVLRGLSTREGDHGRGTYLMRTGYVPSGPVRYPCIGSSMANQLGGPPGGLPGCVSIGSFRTFNEDAFSAGFLGPKLQPLMVGASAPIANKRVTADSAATASSRSASSSSRQAARDIPTSLIPPGFRSTRQGPWRARRQRTATTAPLPGQCRRPYRAARSRAE